MIHIPKINPIKIHLLKNNTTLTTQTRFIWVAIGGALGASLRWLLINSYPIENTFAWPVFIVNIVGSFILGIIITIKLNNLIVNNILNNAVGVGFCGGLTTFSTLSVETAKLLTYLEYKEALIYLFSSITGSLIAVYLGILFTKLTITKHKVKEG